MIKREGYLMIDHRNAPGVAPELTTAKGGEAVPANTLFESATVTCKHCQTVVILNPLRTRERHYCRKCDAYICDACAAVGDCNPFAKTLDKAHSAIEHGRPFLGLLIPNTTE